MSSIVSNADAPNSIFNAFHSFDGFAVLDIELPQTFNQNNFEVTSQQTFQNYQQKDSQIDSLKAVQASNTNKPNKKSDNSQKKSNSQSSSIIFGKSRSLIEFFYTKDKNLIQLDSSIVSLDDYEIF